jgi:hypothetical protein
MRIDSDLHANPDVYAFKRKETHLFLWICDMKYNFLPQRKYITHTHENIFVHWSFHARQKYNAVTNAYEAFRDS